MATYCISGKAGCKFDRFAVEAETYSQAAQIAAKRLNRGKKGIVGERTTGDHSKSGWFQGYRLEGGGLNSTGPAFHVM